MAMTAQPKTTKAINALVSSNISLMARKAPIPTRGTVTMPTTYPATQIAPMRCQNATIATGISVKVAKDNTAINLLNMAILLDNLDN